MKSNKNHQFLIAVFLLSLTLPLAFSNKSGGKLSVMENRYLAVFPVILTNDLKLAPGIKTNGEKWLDDNIGFRTPMKKLQVYLDFNIFHVSPSNKVVIGKDGWFYYAVKNNIPIGLGTYPISKELLERIGENQSDIQAQLKREGIEYIIVFVPSKVSVYPENIGGSAGSRKTLIDTVSEYLQRNTTIPVINTKPNLLEAKKTELVYFKTDTHWNEMGSYIGYRSIINALIEFGIIHSAPATITTTPAAHLGDLTRTMGLVDYVPPEPFKAIKVVSQKAMRIKSTGYDEVFDALTKILDRDTTLYFYRNDKAEPKTLLIFGDSCFASYKTPELLAENFSNLVFVSSYTILEDVVELVKPDIVIFEITERDIDMLSEKKIQ